jgi:hypothetical protein
MKTNELKLGEIYFYFNWETKEAIPLKYAKRLKRKDVNGIYRYQYQFDFVHIKSFDMLVPKYKVLVHQEVEQLIFDTHFNCVMGAVTTIIKRNRAF